MPAPKNYFVFVDLNNVSTLHNLEFVGQIISAGYTSAVSEPHLREQYLNGTANYLPFVVNEQRSTDFASFYCTSMISTYRVEYDAELKRLASFPDRPSRLSAIYAFATKADCIRAHKLYEWDLSSVRKFTLLPDALTKVAKLNMEIISLMRFCYPRAMQLSEGIDRIWMHYWSGRGNLDVDIPGVPLNTRKLMPSGEIWEYLIEGKLKLQGDLHTSIEF